MKKIDNLIQYANNNQLKFEQDLFNCLKIPSISTLKDHQGLIMLNRLTAMGTLFFMPIMVLMKAFQRFFFMVITMFNR